MVHDVQWGILSTAHIAESAFLPALHAVGLQAYAVAGRDKARTEAFAQKHGIERAMTGYESLLDSTDIDAVYVPLPNSLHVEWTINALQAGKAVLCEKPLCASLSQTKEVLDAARVSARPLWEAFVFPYHRQQQRLENLVGSGAIGEVDEIQSEFYFGLRNRQNIRMAPELAGGALNDVGCYPIRFAQLMFASTPKSAFADARWASEGVDEEMRGVLNYKSGGHLVFSCGMTRDSGTFTRLVGHDGEIRITNPFHPRGHDFIEVRRGDDVSIERLGVSEPTFAEAIRHINAVIAEEVAAVHTAVDDSLATEVALDLLHRSARSGKREEG